MSCYVDISRNWRLDQPSCACKAAICARFVLILSWLFRFNWSAQTKEFPVRLYPSFFSRGSWFLPELSSQNHVLTFDCLAVRTCHGCLNSVHDLLRLLPRKVSATAPEDMRGLCCDAKQLEVRHVAIKTFLIFYIWMIKQTLFFQIYVTFKENQIFKHLQVIATFRAHMTKFFLGHIANGLCLCVWICVQKTNLTTTTYPREADRNNVAKSWSLLVWPKVRDLASFSDDASI